MADDAPPTVGEYYFVPLGRERGGYLDLVELPPTATGVEASKAELAYRTSLERDFKTRRKGLRERHKADELTKEEFDAAVDEHKAIWEAKKTELNKKKEVFTAQEAERRRLANEGKADETIVWDEMYRAFDDRPGELFERLRRACLPRVPWGGVCAIASAWVRPGGRRRRQSAKARPRSRRRGSAEAIAPADAERQLRSMLGEGAGAEGADLAGAELAFRRRLEGPVKQAQSALEGCRSARRVKRQKLERLEERLAVVTRQRDDALARLEALRAAMMHGDGTDGPWEESYFRDEESDEPRGLCAERPLRQGEPVPLVRLRGLALEGALVGLLAADIVWGGLTGTNRAHWSAFIERTAVELDRIGPSLRTRAVGAPEDPPFPGLSEPFALAIEGLIAHEVEDLSRLPERGISDRLRRPDIGALLAALARREDDDGSVGGDRSTAAAGDDDPLEAEGRRAAALAHLLEILEARRASEDDA